MCVFLTTCVLHFYFVSFYYINYFSFVVSKNYYCFVAWNQIEDCLERSLEELDLIFQRVLIQVRTIVRVLWSNSLLSHKFLCWVILSKYLPAARWVKEEKENHTSNSKLCYNTTQSMWSLVKYLIHACTFFLEIHFFINIILVFFFNIFNYFFYFWSRKRRRRNWHLKR